MSILVFIVSNFLILCINKNFAYNNILSDFLEGYECGSSDAVPGQALQCLAIKL